MMDLYDLLFWIGGGIGIGVGVLMIVGNMYFYREQINKKLTKLQCKNAHPPYDLQPIPKDLIHNPLTCEFCMKYDMLKKKEVYVEEPHI